MAGFYESDLAFIHDDGFGRHALDAAPYVLSRLESRGIRDGCVIDLGSGSGLLARELTRSGYYVLGIELSKAMVRLARARVSTARFLTGSIFSTEIPKCAAVVSTGECLNYLADPRASLSPLFERVAEALPPGGVFLFDFADVDRGRGSLPMHRVENDWAITVDYVCEPDQHLLERRITTFRGVADSFRRSDEIHKVRLFRPLEVAAQLREAGFKVRFFRGYRDPFPRGVRGIEAVRAETTTP